MFNEWKVAMRRGLLAAAVLSGLSASPVMAQVATPGVSLDRAAAGATAAPQDASLAHSAMKATTYKVGTTAVNYAIFSYAAGGAVGGALLAAIALGASWTLYTVNDYVWDRYDPPPVKQTTGEAFDPQVWRNTKKFLTYKPAIAAVKYATVYVYTRSVMTTLVAGSATVLANTAVFYFNNVAWDYYDWRRSRAVRTVATPP
jgi:uncharacterized membrane protein